MTRIWELYEKIIDITIAASVEWLRDVLHPRDSDRRRCLLR